VLKALDILRPGHDINREQIGTLLHEGLPWHTPERYHPELSSSEAWWAFVRTVLAGAVLGRGYGREESSWVAELAQELILNPETFIPFDDTLPVLQNLHEKGWRYFILSNNYPELPDLVNHPPFYHLIDECITSGLAGYDKPNPGIFEYALELTGYPRKVWMVGDNIKADVRGAEAVGIPSILVRTRTDEPVKFYAADLYEAAEIIGSR
jgi:putative hydrolase of the HAD superfamily